MTQFTQTSTLETNKRRIPRPRKGDFNYYPVKEGVLKVKGYNFGEKDVVLDRELEGFDVVNSYGITDETTVIEAVELLAAANSTATDVSDLTDTEQLLVDCIPVTYAKLQELVTTSSLEVGKRYLITDFAQSYNIFDGGNMTIFEERIGSVEPIIVTASKVNELHKVAISTVYPQDIIHYSLDILDIRDIGFGNGVDTVNANFKGMIYYRKDTVQNVETHYDFRNIKFRRWAVDAVVFDNGTAYVANDVCKSGVNSKIYKCITATTGEGDPTVNTADWALWLDITADAFVSWTADKTLFNIGDINTDNLIINNVTAGDDYNDFYTFGDWYKWVKDVNLGGINLELMIGVFGSSTILLTQKVFKTTDDISTCFSIKFGDNNLPMTLGDKNHSITFGDNNYLMTFGDNNRLMTFGDNNSSMTFGNYNYSMIFGNKNYSMTFGDNNSSMTFGDNNSSMTFGNYNYSMTFGDNNSSMTFGDNNSSMTFGNGNSSMTFGNKNSSMTFGYYNSSMTFGNYTNPQNKIITFNYNTTMCIFEDKCFKGLAADLDLSAATHIRGEYNTTIYQDKTDGVKLSYMDGSVMVIADVTV